MIKSDLVGHFQLLGGVRLLNKMTMENIPNTSDSDWPKRPVSFPSLMTPIEAAMYLRLDELGYTPKAAKRTLKYWRDQYMLKATKYARHVWFLKDELDNFLKERTEK